MSTLRMGAVTRSRLGQRSAFLPSRSLPRSLAATRAATGGLPWACLRPPNPRSLPNAPPLGGARHHGHCGCGSSSARKIIPSGEPSRQLSPRPSVPSASSTHLRAHTQHLHSTPPSDASMDSV